MEIIKYCFKENENLQICLINPLCPGVTNSSRIGGIAKMSISNMKGSSKN